MKTLRHLLLMLPFGLLVAGCGVYNPVVVHIPLIHQKGELQLEGAALPTGRWPVPLDFRASAAWGVSDHLAIAASVDPFRSYSQAMAGFYFPQANNFVWELYVGAGCGKGEVSNFGGIEPWTIPNGSYRSVFVQADAGWLEMTRKAHLDLALSLKAGVLSGSISVGDYVPDTLGGYHIETVTTLSDNFLLEPTAEVRLGWERLKFNVKLGLCWVITYSPTGYRFPYSLLSLGAGMSYRF